MVRQGRPTNVAMYPFAQPRNILHFFEELPSVFACLGPVLEQSVSNAPSGPD
jgi:hypothetical protein